MNNNPIYVCFILTVAVVSLLLLGAGLSLPSQAAPSIPAPSLNIALASMPKPTPPPSAGGSIELHVQFSDAWLQVQWQELWTIVEWQDDKGAWRTVERWQGSLGDASITDGDLRWGKKMWWVAVDDLGKGPFRWTIYRNKDGGLLGRSEPFYLPDSTNAIERIDVTLGLP